MLFRSQTFIALGLWASQVRSVQCGQLTANPSPGTNIVFEESLGNTYPSGGNLSITSDIPVNIQRYADVDGRFFYGEQPVTGVDVRVVVTSDCETIESGALPVVELNNETGGINIKWDAAADLSFLDPTWYDALWSYTSVWAGYLYSTVASINIALDDENGTALTDSTESVVTTDAAISTVITETTTATDGNTVASEEPVTDDGAQDKCPGDEELNEEGTDNSPSSTIRHSFSRQTTTTFMVLYVTNIVLGGIAWNFNPFGFGKVAVAAFAFSALFTKTHPKKDHEVNARDLQTCTFNADILLDGCYNTFTINAPSARIIDAVMVNLTSAQNPNDTATTDYSATLSFPVSGNNTDLQSNTTVLSMECLIMTEGRPFIDNTGKSLQAFSVVEVADSSWLGYLAEDGSEVTSNSFNETGNDLLLLGEEWTRRALAEHASIASFAAFSIALMTNGAPSILVKDSIKAAQDEVRHAKVSFDIASILNGKTVGPGPLPASSLEFKHDMTALALAVAKEGCVDETLSTFAASLEAKDINDVIESGIGNKKYTGLDHGTLSLMRDELKKIAMEEASHSALALRTLNWICSVDSNACNAVHEEVFNGSSVEVRIAQVIFNKRTEVRRLIRSEWEQVFVAHMFKAGLRFVEGTYEQPECIDNGEAENYHAISFISQLTERIRRGVLC